MDGEDGNEKVIIMLNEKVYDVTPYMPLHPGGDIIRNHHGKDATEAFTTQPAHKYVMGFITGKLKDLYIGEGKELLENSVKTVK